jgi:hypothetical protein
MRFQSDCIVTNCCKACDCLPPLSESRAQTTCEGSGMLKPLIRMPASFYAHVLVDAVAIGLFVCFIGVVYLIVSH